MEQKLITAFRAKHKFNLSNERLEKWAKKQVSKIESEEKIEEFLENFDTEPLEEIAKLDDALRLKTKAPETPKVETEEEPEWKKEINALKEQLSKQTTDSLTDSRKSILKDALSGANEVFLKQANRIDVSKYTDEEFNALKDELITDAESFKIDASKAKPFFGGVKLEGGLTAEQKEIVDKF